MICFHTIVGRNDLLAGLGWDCACLIDSELLGSELGPELECAGVTRRELIGHPPYFPRSRCLHVRGQMVSFEEAAEQCQALPLKPSGEGGWLCCGALSGAGQHVNVDVDCWRRVAHLAIQLLNPLVADLLETTSLCNTRACFPKSLFVRIAPEALELDDRCAAGLLVCQPESSFLSSLSWYGESVALFIERPVREVHLAVHGAHLSVEVLLDI